jgi:hypothetical protein
MHGPNSHEAAELAAAEFDDVALSHDQPIEGYALHTGAARSTEDVTIRGGQAPILARGEGAGEGLQDITGCQSRPSSSTGLD